MKDEVEISNNHFITLLSNSKYNDILPISDFSSLGYEQSASFAGRVSSVRRHGKVIFFNIFDETETPMQIFALVEEFEVLKNLSLWDIVKVNGVKSKSASNKVVLLLKKIELQSVSYVSPQKTFFSSENKKIDSKFAFETLCNRNIFNDIKLRFSFITIIRKHMQLAGFEEVITPILNKVPSGTEELKPFKTFHNFLDKDVYLRVAPECFLKRLIVSGFTKIFEIGPCFRNEGSSTKHIQEFIALEAYATNYKMHDMIDLISNLINSISFHFEKENLTFKTVSIFDLIKDFFLKKTFDEVSIEDMLSLLNDNKIKNREDKNYVSYLFLDKFLVNKIETPTFVLDIPKSVSPLAKAKEENKEIANRAILFINKMEIAEIYFEENDYKAQYECLKNDEFIDYDFLDDLSCGMPTLSGFGIGVDRLISVLNNSKNIRDNIPFPIS